MTPMRVAMRHRLGLVVGDIEDGRAELLLDALELEPQFGAQLGVERGQRLVHQVDRGRAHQRAADGDALHLAARQLGAPVAELVLDTEQAARPRSILSRICVLRHAPGRRAQGKGEVVVDREMRIERILLEDEGDVARRRRLARHVAPADEDRAGVRRLEPATSRSVVVLPAPVGPSSTTNSPSAMASDRSLDRLDVLEGLGDAVEADLSHGRPPSCSAVRIARPDALSKMRQLLGPESQPHASRRWRAAASTAPAP